MKFSIITDARVWDAFVSSQPGAQFTQSWAWGEFRVACGQEVKRFAMEDGKGIVAAAQCIRYPKKILGGYWYVPRGPIIRHDSLDQAKEILGIFFEELFASVCGKSCFFLRCEPPLEWKRDDHPLSKDFLRSHAFQPASTSLINLTKSEEELLSRMHEKTRYNVRLSERKGVTVRLASSKEDVETFLQLNEETAARDAFTSHSTAYIRSTHEALAPFGMSRIRLAESGKKILAASLEIVYGDTVTYLYGASSSAQRNLMAPYALHWSAIQEAKKDGFRFYDLYGINPEDKNSPYFKPSWEGITRFKEGWGGARVDFVGTWERPRSPFLYRALRFAQKIVKK